MDLLEITDNINRYPWELSSTYCILKQVKHFKLNNIYDIGAGDCFFTSHLSDFVQGEIFAVDKGFDIKKVMNLDYFICVALSHLGLYIPGLSILVICKKEN